MPGPIPNPAQVDRGRKIAEQLQQSAEQLGPAASERMRAALSIEDVKALDSFRAAEFDKLVARVEDSPAGAEIRWSAAERAYASKLERTGMSDPESGAASATGSGSAKPQLRQDRASAVYASAHATGRERLAAQCLSAFPSATADEITTFLATQPRAGERDDDDVAQGREMLEMMKARGNAELSSSGHTGMPSGRAQAAAVWARARAANQRHTGEEARA